MEQKHTVAFKSEARSKIPPPIKYIYNLLCVLYLDHCIYKYFIYSTHIAQVHVLANSLIKLNFISNISQAQAPKWWVQVLCQVILTQNILASFLSLPTKFGLWYKKHIADCWLLITVVYSSSWIFICAFKWALHLLTLWVCCVCANSPHTSTLTAGLSTDNSLHSGVAEKPPYGTQVYTCTNAFRSLFIPYVTNTRHPTHSPLR